MGYTNNMSVKIITVSKALPNFSSTTAETIPFLDAWLVGQEERFIKKVKKPCDSINMYSYFFC